MTNQIICPKCRRLQVPLEESGQLICPACASILPSNLLLPELAAKVSDRGSLSGSGSSSSPSSTSSALDEPGPRTTPIGAMTLLRKDLRTGVEPTKQNGWLDNVLPRRPKSTTEKTSPSVVRNPRMQPEAKIRQEAPPVVRAFDDEDSEDFEESLSGLAPITDEHPQFQNVEAREAEENSSSERIAIVPILTILGFIAISTIALLQNQGAWSNVLLFATTVLLVVSVLGIVQRQDTRKAFWQGFALFGWGYLVMAFIPCFPYQAGMELPTTPVIKIVHAKVTGSVVDARDSFQIMKGTPVVLPASLEPETADLKETVPKAASAFFVPGEIKQFVVVGHCLLALLAALLGSSIAQWFYRSKLSTI